MLDGVVSSVVEVWGFEVPIGAGGRKRWPAKLRAMAVKRIADGEGTREISEEIGAHKSLVAHWVKQIPLEQGGPKFFEVMAPQEKRPVADTKANSPTLEEKNTMLCRIRVGDTEIAIPPSYPAGDLAEILRVVRAAQ